MFTCGRCGKTHIEPYKNQVHEAEGNLQCFRPPEGWRNDTISLPLMCDVCSKAFDDFMKAGSAKKKSCENCAKKAIPPYRHGDCNICVQARYPDGSESDPSHWQEKEEP